MKKENLKKKIRQLEKRLKKINKILNNDKTTLREFLLAMNNKKDLNIERLYQDRIYKSCGNGYYEDITEKIDKFYEDNGQKYIEKIKELNLFPQYDIR